MNYVAKIFHQTLIYNVNLKHLIAAVLNWYTDIGKS